MNCSKTLCSKISVLDFSLGTFLAPATLCKFVFTVLFIFTLPLSLARADDASGVEGPLRATAHFREANLEVGRQSEVLIQLDLDREYHAYSDRFKLQFLEPSAIKLASFQISPQVKFKDSVTKTMKDGIAGRALFTAKFEVPATLPPNKYKVQMALTYQACTEDHCLFPKTLTLVAPLTVTSGQIPAAQLNTQNSNLSPIANDPSPELSTFEAAQKHGLIWTLLFLFSIGFLTSLTPCVYPMIPLTLAVLGTRQTDQTLGKKFLLSLTYVLGIALTYSILGVIAAQTGQLFGSSLGNPYVVTGLAIIFAVMALGMWDVVEIQPPAFLRDRFGRAHKSKGFSGAFSTGVVAGVIASPCIGPVLVSILTYISKTQNSALGFLFLFTFAMGLGTLFLILGTFSHLLTKLPRSGPWMESVKFVFGLVMFGMAIKTVAPVYPEWLLTWLFAGILLATSVYLGAFQPHTGSGHPSRLWQIKKLSSIMLLVFGIAASLWSLALSSARFFPQSDFARVLTGLQLGASAARPTSSAPVLRFHNGWQEFSKEKLAQAEVEKKPVIIDFYADWCGACVELDEKSFSDPAVIELGKKFVLLRVDATVDTDLIRELKTKYTILGLPSVLFIDANGTEREDLRLTGFEDAQNFLVRMRTMLK